MSESHSLQHRRIFADSSSSLNEEIVLKLRDNGENTDTSEKISDDILPHEQIREGDFHIESDYKSAINDICSSQRIEFKDFVKYAKLVWPDYSVAAAVRLLALRYFQWSWCNRRMDSKMMPTPGCIFNDHVTLTNGSELGVGIADE